MADINLREVLVFTDYIIVFSKDFGGTRRKAAESLKEAQGIRFETCPRKMHLCTDLGQVS